jgi:hypothetical protein
VEGLSPTERAHPEKRLQEIATQFRQNYTEPLQWLIDRAKTENHRVAIVVFGLANLETFFKARRKAEALHAKNPALYPYFESGNRSFRVTEIALSEEHGPTRFNAERRNANDGQQSGSAAHAQV